MHSVNISVFLQHPGRFGETPSRFQRLRKRRGQQTADLPASAARIYSGAATVILFKLGERPVHEPTPVPDFRWHTPRLSDVVTVARYSGRSKHVLNCLASSRMNAPNMYTTFVSQEQNFGQR